MWDTKCGVQFFSSISNVFLVTLFHLSIFSHQVCPSFAVELALRFSSLVVCYLPFPAILFQLGNWLGFSQEGSHQRVYALISPFGGNGSDFSASPVQH